MHRVVVVGGSLAAVHAIDGLRDNDFQGEIILVGGEAHLPYDRPPLSKEALRSGPAEIDVLLKSMEWYSERGVQLRVGQRAQALDTGARAVLLDGGEVLPYDGLVIATGSRARSLRGEPRTVPIYRLRTLEDAQELHTQLVPGRHLVVIGAGFIGLEVAATAKEMGLDVSVIEVAPVPLTRVLGDEAGRWFHEYQTAHGVDLYCGAVLEGIEPSSTGGKVRLRDGTVLSADVIVAGVGASPATEWLESSGLKLSDGVLCDKSLRTSAPDVVAAGDVARWYHALFDEELRVEQWYNAVEQGRHAAQSLLGGSDAYAAVPYFWSDQFDAKMRFVGRANACSQVSLQRTGDTSMVVLFGRDGVLHGALCVNAARQLAMYRKAISDQVAWNDVVKV